MMRSGLPIQVALESLQDGVTSIIQPQGRDVRRVMVGFAMMVVLKFSSELVCCVGRVCSTMYVGG